MITSVWEWDDYDQEEAYKHSYSVLNVMYFIIKNMTLEVLKLMFPLLNCNWE